MCLNNWSVAVKEEFFKKAEVDLRYHLKPQNSMNSSLQTNIRIAYWNDRWYCPVCQKRVSRSGAATAKFPREDDVKASRLHSCCSVLAVVLSTESLRQSSPMKAMNSQPPQPPRPFCFHPFLPSWTRHAKHTKKSTSFSLYPRCYLPVKLSETSLLLFPILIWPLKNLRKWSSSSSHEVLKKKNWDLSVSKGRSK